MEFRVAIVKKFCLYKQMNKNLLLVGAAGLVLVAVGAGVMILNKTEPVKEEVVLSVSGEPTKAVMVEEIETTDSEVKRFTVEGSNFKYSPAEIKVKKGDRVEVTFKNIEGTHDFVVDEFEARTNQIGADEEETIEFTADKAGTFEYYCSVGQHRKMGMVGKLIVE